MAKLGFGFLSRLVPGQEICALDVGYSNIKVVLATVGRGGARVKRVITRPTDLNPSIPPEDVFDQVANVLRSLWKEEKIGRTSVVSVIPGRAVFVRQLKMPFVTGDRLDRIVRYEAKQQIPFPLEQMRIAYHVFPPGPTGELDVTLVAVKRDVVEEHVSLLQMAQILPETIDVSSLGLFNFLVDQPVEPGVVTACVNIGASTTDIVIESGGVLKFMRSAPVGGNILTMAVERELEFPFQEAEELKIERGRVADYSAGRDEFDQSMTHTLETALERSIVNEIRKSIDFFISQPEGLTVNRVVVTGGTASLPGIETFLEDRLGLPVEKAKAENIRSLDLTAVIPLESEDICSVSLGLVRRIAAPESLQLNFTPDWIEHKKEFRARRGALFVQVLLLIVLAGLCVFKAQLEVGRLSLAAQHVQDVVTMSDRLGAALKRMLTERKRLDDQIACLNEIQGLRGKYLKALVSIIEAMPGVSVWLESVATVAPQGLVIRGQTNDTAGMQEFLKVLNRDKRFLDLKMGPGDPVPGAEKFEITMSRIMYLDPALEDLLSRVYALEPQTLDLKDKGKVFHVAFVGGTDLAKRIPDLIELVLGDGSSIADLANINQFQVVTRDELTGQALDAWQFDKETAKNILRSNPPWNEYAAANRIDPEKVEPKKPTEPAAPVKPGVPGKAGAPAKPAKPAKPATATTGGKVEKLIGRSGAANIGIDNP